MKRLVQLLVVEGAVGGPLTACDNTWARTNAAAPAPQATIQTATTIEDKTTKEVRGLPVNRIRGRASPAGWRTYPSHQCSGRVPLMPTTKNSPPPGTT